MVTICSGPSSSLFFSNKALHKETCIILVPSEVTEAKDNWTIAMALKFGDIDYPHTTEPGKMTVLGSVTRGPNSLGFYGLGICT